MDVVWRLGEATAEQVREAMPGRPHDSTVRTLMRVLESKGYLSHEARGKAYVYRATVGRQKAQRLALRSVLDPLLRRLGRGPGAAADRGRASVPEPVGGAPAIRQVARSIRSERRGVHREPHDGNTLVGDRAGLRTRPGREGHGHPRARADRPARRGPAAGGARLGGRQRLPARPVAAPVRRAAPASDAARLPPGRDESAAARAVPVALASRDAFGSGREFPDRSNRSASPCRSNRRPRSSRSPARTIVSPRSATSADDASIAAHRAPDRPTGLAGRRDGRIRHRRRCTPDPRDGFARGRGATPQICRPRRRPGMVGGPGTLPAAIGDRSRRGAGVVRSPGHPGGPRLDEADDPVAGLAVGPGPARPCRRRSCCTSCRTCGGATIPGTCFFASSRPFTGRTR